MHKGKILIGPCAYYLTGHFVFLFLKHSRLLLIFGNVVIWKVGLDVLVIIYFCLDTSLETNVLKTLFHE